RAAGRWFHRRRGRLRPRARPGPGHVRRATPVLRGHRACLRRRRAGRRGRDPHRRDPRPGAPPRARLMAWLRRNWVRATALVITSLLALNVLGVLRYPGGPLREASADGILWLDTRPADEGSI